jgi:hypothetical protein
MFLCAPRNILFVPRPMGIFGKYIPHLAMVLPYICADVEHAQDMLLS